MAIILPPIKEVISDYDELAEKIAEAYRDQIYLPLLESLGEEPSKLLNAKDSPLTTALKRGKISYIDGRFEGPFNAKISKELKSHGAVWERKTLSFKIPLEKLPLEIRIAVQSSATYFQEKLSRFDKTLQDLQTGNVSIKINLRENFSRLLWKTNKKVDDTLKNIIILPQFSKGEAEALANSWQNNMDLWIKDWTEDRIKNLRKDVLANVTSGKRFESLIKDIQKSYSVTQSKAKFLARQETMLAMNTLKEQRYKEAGIERYIWKCVVGTPNHPVRPSHKILDGTTHRWDTPPITSAPNEPQRRNNPGFDYNCRCVSLPLAEF